MKFSRRFACVASVAGTLALATVLASGEAAAGHRNHAGDAAAAGIIGLAAGAVLGSVLTAPQAPPPAYYAPPPREYYAPPPVRYAPPPPPRVYYAPPPPPPVYYTPARSFAPWTPEWSAYCARKYRSFDPRSGTYITYRGEERFCQG